MIFYFSGTGNSKWIGEEVAKGTNDQLTSISELMKNKVGEITVKKGETIGIVFPVYAWQAPEMVVNFVKCLKVDKDNFVVGICTCGEEAGLTMKKLATHIRLDSTYSIVMPSNYLLGGNMDSEEVIKTKIEEARNNLAEIIDNINKKEKIHDIHTGKLCGLKSNVANYFFNQFGRGTKAFLVEDSCNSCGLCQQVCPTGCIKLIDNKPVWGNDCAGCLACINYCPEKSIQYGKNTKNKERYFFKG